MMIFQKDVIFSFMGKCFMITLGPHSLIPVVSVCWISVPVVQPISSVNWIWVWTLWEALCWLFGVSSAAAFNSGLKKEGLKN